MDKETLIKLATPASIFALAFSIISASFIAKAEYPYNVGASFSNPLHIYHTNTCN